MRALSPLCCLLVGACILPDKIVVSSVSAPDPVDSADSSDGYCEERSYDVGLSEATELGFSASDVLALVAGPREATLTYADGSTTTVTVSAEHDGGHVYYVDSAAVGAAPDCEDHLELAVQVHLSTADGQFNETMVASLTPSALTDGLSLGFAQSADDVTGSFSLDGADLLLYSMFVSADLFTGEIIAEDEPTGEEDPYRTCGVGAWGVALDTGCW